MILEEEEEEEMGLDLQKYKIVRYIHTCGQQRVMQNGLGTPDAIEWGLVS